MLDPLTVALLASSAAAAASTAVATVLWRGKVKPPVSYIIGGACIIIAASVFGIIIADPLPLIATACWFAAASVPVIIGWRGDGERERVQNLEADLKAAKAQIAELQAARQKS